MMRMHETSEIGCEFDCETIKSVNDAVVCS